MRMASAYICSEWGIVSGEWFYTAHSLLTSARNHLRKKVPQNNTGRNYHIKRVLGAELRDLNADVDIFHNLIAYPIYLIAKYYRITCCGLWFKIVEHQAILGLLNRNDEVTFRP